MSKRPKKLLDQVLDAIRRKHYSIRTEEAYVRWTGCQAWYIRFQAVWQ